MNMRQDLGWSVYCCLCIMQHVHIPVCSKSLQHAHTLTNTHTGQIICKYDVRRMGRVYGCVLATTSQHEQAERRSRVASTVIVGWAGNWSFWRVPSCGHALFGLQVGCVWGGSGLGWSWDGGGGRDESGSGAQHGACVCDFCGTCVHSLQDMCVAVANSFWICKHVCTCVYLGGGSFDWFVPVEIEPGKYMFRISPTATNGGTHRYTEKEQVFFLPPLHCMHMFGWTWHMCMHTHIHTYM